MNRPTETHAAVMHEARQLLVAVVLGNPAFSRDEAIAHTIEGVAEQFELSSLAIDIVRAELACCPPAGRDAKYWRETILGSTTRIDADHLARAALLAEATDIAGRPCGAWHAVHATCQPPSRHPCPCAKCSPQARRFT